MKVNVFCLRPKKNPPLKQCFLLLIGIILCLLRLICPKILLSGEISSENNQLKEDLENTITDQLSSLDLAALNKFFEEFCTDRLNLFGESSLISKIESIISGEFALDATSFFSAIINVLFEEVLAFLPLISSIIAIVVLGSLLVQLKSKNSSVADIVHFVCFGIVIIIVMSMVGKMLAITEVVLGALSTQMEIVFPILLTLLTAIGGTVSASVYQPAVALLTTAVSKVFSAVLLPLFIFAVVLNIVSNISSSVKLDKLADFILTLFKWIIGIVFTIFMGFLAIQGITAGSVDTISFKTARYSLSTYIPIVGGYLSEGLNLILASSLLIKNAIGSCGLLIMLSTIAIPLIQLIIFMFSLKFVGAILQPLNDNRMPAFLSGMGKLFVLPIVMILAVSFMYLVFVSIIMCTSFSV